VVFGAFVAIQWPKKDESVGDASLSTFLFQLDGPEPKRFPAVEPPRLFSWPDGISVGELNLNLRAGTYSCDKSCCCTAAPDNFPAVSGTLEAWEIVRL
jgi:hypothetical protein